MTSNIKQNIKIFLQGVVFAAVFSYSFAQTIIPANSTITDPVAQGYATCTPGNCVIQTVSGSGNVASGTATNSMLFWNGSAWTEVTAARLDSSGRATFTSATTTNIFSTNASITNATTTSFFSAILSAISAIFTNLITTNFIATNATTTNLIGSNATITNATVTNLAVLNGATQNLSVATSSFASSTMIGATITGAVNTGIFFLHNGVLTQDTGDFNYDPVTNKLTVTGGIDPLYFQAKDIASGTGAYYEAYNGSAAAVSAANTGRLRYSTSTQSWEISNNGGAYTPIAVSGGSISWVNATGGVATITNILAVNNLLATGTVNFTGTSTLSTSTISSSTITWANIGNLFASIINAVTATIQNLTTTNLIATEATTTNATTTNLNLTGYLRDGYNTVAQFGQVLLNTGTTTKWVATSSLGFDASNVTNNSTTTIAAPVTNIVSSSTVINSTTTAINSSTTNITSLATTSFTSATTTFSSVNTSINSTTTNITSSATTTLTSLNTVINSSTTNINSSSTVITGTTTLTNLVSQNSSVTNSTTSNLYTSVFNALAATISDLIFTNATGTNATTTNLFSTLANFTTAIVSNLIASNATITNSTTTNVFANNINSQQIAVSGNASISGTTTLATTTATSISGNQLIIALGANSTTTNALYNIGGQLYFNGSALGLASAGNDTVFFNNSGVRLATTTNSFLIGGSSTTTNSKLEVQGSTFVSATTTLGATVTISGPTTISNNLSVTGNATITNATTTNIFANTASTSNLYVGATATMGAISLSDRNANSIPWNIFEATTGGLVFDYVGTQARLTAAGQFFMNALSVSGNATTGNATTTSLATGNLTATGTATLANEIVTNSIQTNSTITSATITNSNIATIVSGGTSSFATTTVSSSSITWLNVLNTLWANILNVLTLNTTNLAFTNATGTNATTTGSFVSNNITATGTTALATTTAATTTISNLTVTGTSTLATTTATNLTVGSSTLTASSTFGGTTSTPQLVVYGDIVSKGTQWTVQQSAADNTWSDVAYGNGTFVAVGSTGSGNRVMTSSDGVNWTTRTSAADNSWTGVAYGNGLFVAVASSGTGNRVMTSPDGINWTSRVSAVDNDWVSVTYGNGLFVAVSNTGTGDRVMTSPDGINWTSRTSALDNLWSSVVYGNGLFVAVSRNNNSNRVMTSPDGITWTIRNTSSATDNTWESVTYGNGLFVAVSQGAVTNGVMTSPNGINWTSRTAAVNNNWFSVTYGNGLFVAVAKSGTGNRVMTSPDGITWTTRTSVVDNAWEGVTYGNGMFVAVSSSGTGNRVMTSGKIEDTFTQNQNKSIFTAVANFLQGFTSTGTSTLATTTSASSTVTTALNVLGTLFASVFNALNFTATNATITNATSTNLVANNGAFLNATTTNLTSVNATITNSTSTNVVSTNVTASNLQSTSATLTNATTTNNLAATGGITANTNRQVVSASGTVSVVQFDITGDGTNYNFDYNLDGVSDATDPIITLVRGMTYKFNMSAAGHPFEFRVSNGGAAYTSGITNNATAQGIVTFTVPFNAPNSLVYQCTSHAGMVGQIKIVNAGELSDDNGVTRVVANLSGINIYGNIDASTSNATISNATTTNFYSQIFTALTTVFTNLLATNGTVTNATSTNFFATLGNFTTAIISSLTGTNATITNATTTNLASTNISATGLLTNTGTTTLATTTILGTFEMLSAVKDSFGATGTAGQVLSSTGTSTRWITNTSSGGALVLADNGTILAASSTASIILATNTSATVSIGSSTAVASSTFGGTTSTIPSLTVYGGVVDRGVTWTKQTAQTGIRGIAYGNGLFVAARSTGGISTSDDGVNWTIRTTPNSNSHEAITYGNGLFVAVASNGTNQIITSPDGITWTERSTPAAQYYSITYGNGTFVAVGISGAVMTSTDGITWTSRTAAAANSWMGVTYGNGQFVAVAQSGSGNRVMTSPDGITWTSRTTTLAQSWQGIAYGNGLYVATNFDGTNNFIMTSQDAITWTTRTIPVTDNRRGITFGNGLFVSVGSTGIITSGDGITWTQRGPSLFLYAVAYGNGLFVAGQNVLYTSGKIEDATLASNSKNIFASLVNFIRGFGVGTSTNIYGGELTPGITLGYNTVAGTNMANTLVLYAATGTANIATGTNALYNVNGSLYFNGAQVGAGSSPFVTSGGNIINSSSTANLVLATSTNQIVSVGSTTAVGSTTLSGTSLTPSLLVYGDVVSKGLQWTAQTPSAATSWYSVTYGNGMFVAVSYSGQVMTSTDGTNWTSRTAANSNQWRSVTYGNGLFVAVAQSGTGNRVMTSPDGITWTARTSAADNNWQSVTYANGQFVAVSDTGTTNRVMTSTDGVNWVSRTSPIVDTNWQSVTYGNGKYVAVASSGLDSDRIMYSTNGITWATTSSIFTNSWRSVAYGNGLFVAVSSDGGNRVIRSVDGVNWDAGTAAAANQWYGVTYGNGLFVAVASTGTGGNGIMTSSDGVTWTTRTATSNNFWKSVVYGNGLFVAVADGGGAAQVMTSGKIEDSSLANQDKNIFAAVVKFMQAIGIGTTTNQYGGSLVEGITLGMKNILGTQIASVLQIGSATGTANVSTTSNALYNVNGSLYFNGSQVGGGSQTITNVTASGTLTTWNTTYTVNDVAGAGSLLLTLPTPVGNSGKTIEIKKVSTTTNAITLLVNSTTTQLIDGSIAYTLTQYNNAVVIRSDGSNYQVVGNTGSGQVGASFLRAKLNTDQTTDTSGGVDHIKFATVTNSNGGDVVLDTTSAYSSTANTASIGRFTLKAGKTYRLVSDVQGPNNTGNKFSYEWFNADTNNSLGGGRGFTVGSSNADSAATRGSTAEAIYTPSVDTRVEVKITGNVLSTISSDSSGQMSTYAFIEVIAGNAPVTGSSVDYVEASRITSDQTAVGINTDLVFNKLITGNIPLNTTTGVFTLSAGKTYELIGEPSFINFSNTTGGYLEYGWVDANTNALLATQGTGIANPYTWTGAENNSPIARIIYTPTTNQTVKLRVTGNGVGTADLRGVSWSKATIKQLGSSATTEYTNNVLGDFPTGGVVMSGTLSEYINHIQVNQTTQYQTLTLPNPTNTALSRIVYIDNIGTANFDMHGITIVSGGTGAFKWNGTAWKNFGIVGGNVASEFGETNLPDSTITTTSFADITGSSFTLPTAGTWEVQYFITSGGTNNANPATFIITDTSDNFVAGSASQNTSVTTAGSPAITIAQTVRITTTGSTSYKMRGKNDVAMTTTIESSANGNDNEGNSKITWKKISGFIPVAGTSVDYVNAKLTSDQSVLSGAAIPVVTEIGNISNSSGVFSLSAGKTYRLTASMGHSSTNGAAAVNWQWRNITANSLIGSLGISLSQQAATDAGTIGVAEAIITPTVNTTVRVENVTGATRTFSSGSGVTITQIGSSAILQDSILAIGGNTFSTLGSYFNVGSINNAGIQFMASSSVAGGFNYSSSTNSSTFYVGTSSPNLAQIDDFAFYMNNLGGFISSTTRNVNTLVIGSTTVASTSLGLLENIALYVEGAIAKFAKRTVNGTDVAASLIFESATSSVATTTNALYALNGQLMYNGFQIGTSSQVVASFMQIALAGNQTTAGEIDDGSHLKYAQILAQYGNDISLDTTTAYTETLGAASIGRVTLKAGKTYKLTANTRFNATGGNVSSAWYNVNAGAGTQIGGSGQAIDVAGAGGVPQPVVTGIITPSTDTLVELRILAPSGIVSVIDDNNAPNATWATIEVIAGNSAVTGQSVSNGGVSLIGRQTINAANTFQNVNFNTVKTSGGMTVTTGTTPITITTTGRYLLTFNTGLDENANVANEVNIKLRKNSTDIASTTSYLASGVGDVASINTIADLVAGDVISVQVRFVSGTANDIQQSELSVSQLGTSAITSDSIVAVGGNQMSSNSSVLTIGTTNSNLLQFIASSSIGAGLAYATNSGLATTTTFFVGTSSPTTSLFSGIAMYVNGAIARTFGSNFATTSAYAVNVDFGNTSRVRVNSTSANFLGITGIAGGTDGEELTIVNASSTQAFTLYDHTATTSSVAANRIITGTGANLTLAGDASINLVYDATASTTGRWRVVGGSGGSSGGSTAILTLTNFTASTSVGTAAATVDTYGTINIAQASSSVVLTLPNPTVLTSGKTITVNNTGTAMFTMYDTQITTSESGIFTWNGSSWKSITGKGNVGAEIGENVSITNGQTIGTSLADVTGSSFTLPTAGTWLVRYEIFASSGNSSQFAVRVYDNSNNLVPNSQSSNQSFASSATQAMGNTVTITTTGPATYKLRGISDAGTWTIYNNDNAASGGRSRITWNKISGNAAVTGATVDYVHARFTTNQAVTAGTDITGGNTWSAISGNIPVSTAGVFTLTAGKTYELSAFMNVGSATGNEAMRYQWVDSATNAVLAVTSGASADPTFSAPNSNTSPSFIVYTPTTNQTVKLRVSDVNGGPDVLGTGTNEAAGSYVVIKQLGSNATTEYANTGLGNFTASSTYDTQILGASTTKVSAYTNHYSIAQTTTGITLAINQPENTALSRIIYIDNTGTANFQMHDATVGAGESVAFKWNGTNWRPFGRQADNVASEYGQANIVTSSFGTSATDLVSFTLPSAGTWEVTYAVSGYSSGSAGINDSGIWLSDNSNTVVPDSQGHFYHTGATTELLSVSQTARITTTGSATYKLRAQTSNNSMAIYTGCGSTGSNSSQCSKVVYKKISGYLPVLGQTVASGQVSVANQVFNTNTFVASSNGTYSLPVAGTYSLRYDVTTDGTGANTNSHLAIFDASGTVVAGTERARGGGITTSQVLTAEAIVTVTAPTTYTLRARNGGSGSVTILNSAVSQSQISWTQLGSSAATAGSFAALGGNSADVTLGTLTNNFFRVIASSTEYMRVLATGQGLIGTTTVNTTVGTSTLAIVGTTTNGTANILSLISSTGSTSLVMTNSGSLMLGSSTAPAISGGLGLYVETNYEGGGNVILRNTSASTTAYTGLELRNGATELDGLTFAVAGQNLSYPGTVYFADSVVMSAKSNLSNGMTLVTESTTGAIRFATGGASTSNTRMTINSTGQILVSTTTINAVVGTSTLALQATTTNGSANVLSLFGTTGSQLLNITNAGRLSMGTTTANYGAEIALNGAGSLRLSAPVGADNIFTFNSRGVDNFSIRGTNGADAYLNSVNGAVLYLGAASTPAGAIVNQMAFRADGRVTVGGGTVQAAGNILSIASSTITGTNALLSIGTSTTGGILNVLANGNIGIGSSSPSNLLSLNGGNGILSIAGTAAPSVLFDSTSGSDYIFGSNSVISGAGIYDSTANGWRLVVKDTTGNVGIGTTTPDQKLSISGANTSIRLYDTASNDSGWMTRFTDRLHINSTDEMRIFAGATDTTNGNGLVILNTGEVRPNLDNNVSLGAGTNRWTAVYAVNGTIQTSDERLKTNILDLSGSSTLEMLNNIRTVTYNWKDGQGDNRNHIGFIAQNLASITPSAVYGDPTSTSTFLGVNYSEIVPLTVKAIQELNNRMFSSKPVTALTIEEITASSTISVDDKLKALGMNAKTVNDMLAQLASSTSATSTVTTTESVTYSTSTQSIWVNASGTACTFNIENGCNISSTTIVMVPSTTTATVEETTFVGKLIARIVEVVKDLLANVGVAKVKTQQLCVANANGEETCLTKEQLDNLIQNAGNQNPPAPNPNPEPEPDPTPDTPPTPPAPPTPPTCIEPQILNPETNTCE